MTLLFSNENIEKLLDMPSCLSILEEAYADYGRGLTLSLPRQDNLIACGRDDAYYAFKHMGAAWPKYGIMALRLNSDIISYYEDQEAVRRRKLPMAGGRWVGLIELFSLKTGEMLAIFPDGVAQRIRVGATNGLGLKYLARSDSRRVGLLGGGWQAGAQLMALNSLLPIEEIKVYSPTRGKLEQFVEEQRRLHDTSIVPADSADQCVKGVDLIMCATSSMKPVLDPDWIKPGIHVSCIKPQEVSLEVLKKCDKVVLHSRVGKNPDNVLPGTPNVPKQLSQGWWRKDGSLYEDFPELSELILEDREHRASPGEITCFVNNFGLGIQFAAVGAQILQKSESNALARPLPADWFSQDVHP